MTDAAPGAVLDASAMLAYLQGEAGREVVGSALADGAIINVVNYAEVLSRLGDAGNEPTTVHRQLTEQGLIGRYLELVPLHADDAITIARLRPLTRSQGLSQGDRACLATGLRLGRPKAIRSVQLALAAGLGVSHATIWAILWQRPRTREKWRLTWALVTASVGAPALPELADRGRASS